jgi:hypothetical protein
MQVVARQLPVTRLDFALRKLVQMSSQKGRDDIFVAALFHCSITSMDVVASDTQTWYRLQALAQVARIAEAFQAFKDAGIEPILFKGWAAARHYPPDVTRRPGDIDLAVSEHDYQKARKLLRTPDVARLNIDLKKGFGSLDTVSWDDLVEHSILLPIDQTFVRVLCEEDHLRVLSTHWLIDGGRFRDKLWDIYYAVENRKPDFDWNRCLEIVPAHRRRWVLCTVALAHRYFGLGVSGLPFAAELAIVPPWVIKCIEREWRQTERLEPILSSTRDKRLLLHQLLRRMPPNPIRATIEANGDLYGRRRWWYQVGVIGHRAGPFMKDTARFVRLKVRRRGNR